MEKELTVSAPDFKKLLDQEKVRFIFDLRNEEDFGSWRIEGRGGIETLNIPQRLFVAEEEKYIDRFPKDRRIFAVCAHGDSSRYSAEYLQSCGLDAVSLDGGMDAWSEYYETAKANSSPDIYQILRVARGCIAYLIASGKEAIVIDVSRHVRPVLELAGSLGVRIKYVLDTHLHADHISGGRELASAAGAEYLVHPADLEGAGIKYSPLTDGMRFAVGAHELVSLHSPGHTPGSSSFLLDRSFLFSGDTIMKGSIGRPDLGGRASEWSALLHKTLFERYAALPDGTVVLPAHSASIAEQEGSVIKTTLGAARREKDLYQIRDLPAFISFVEANLPENPERYQDIRKVNLGLIEADEAYRKELEIGKNLCGMAK